MKIAPFVVSETNLSHAWGRVLWRIAKTPGSEVNPLMITLSGFGPDGEVQEDKLIRDALDAFLAKQKKWSVEIVAFTIFPQRYYVLSGGNREDFYKICEDALPHLIARNGGHDFYFGRLMRYGTGVITDNQLEFIISEYLAGKRRTSAFQATIYDPGRDQSHQPYQTFPCLQSVSFVPTESGLVMNSFYAMQYLVQRGYGNLLGLAQLGAFVGREMKLPLVQLNLVAGVERLDFPKRDIAPIIDIIQQRVADLDPIVTMSAA